MQRTYAVRKNESLPTWALAILAAGFAMGYPLAVHAAGPEESEGVTWEAFAAATGVQTIDRDADGFVQGAPKNVVRFLHKVPKSCFQDASGTPASLSIRTFPNSDGRLSPVRFSIVDSNGMLACIQSRQSECRTNATVGTGCMLVREALNNTTLFDYQEADVSVVLVRENLYKNPEVPENDFLGATEIFKIKTQATRRAEWEDSRRGEIIAEITGCLDQGNLNVAQRLMNEARRLRMPADELEAAQDRILKIKEQRALQARTQELKSFDARIAKLESTSESETALDDFGSLARELLDLAKEGRYSDVTSQRDIKARLMRILVAINESPDAETNPAYASLNLDILNEMKESMALPEKDLAELSARSDDAEIAQATARCANPSVMRSPAAYYYQCELPAMKLIARNNKRYARLDAQNQKLNNKGKFSAANDAMLSQLGATTQAANAIFQNAAMIRQQQQSPMYYGGAGFGGQMPYGGGMGPGGQPVTGGVPNYGQMGGYQPTGAFMSSQQMVQGVGQPGFQASPYGAYFQQQQPPRM